MGGKKKKRQKNEGLSQENFSETKDGNCDSHGKKPCCGHFVTDPDIRCLRHTSVASRIGDASQAKIDTDEMGELRNQLMDMPFEELQQLKEKVGVKMYKQVLFGDRTTTTKKQHFKRENKNRPMEMSSRKPVPLLKSTVPVKKKVQRDPRFDDLSGEYHEHFFKQAYSFLGDVKQRDKLKLLKKYKGERDPEKRKQMESLIRRMTQQEQTEKDKEVKQKRERERKKLERQKVKEGKQPYYLKQSEKKKLDLAEKYKELKKSGKLEKYLQRKRKKNAVKERKLLPNKPN